VGPEDEGLICAYVDRSYGFTCPGDSEGPLVLFSRDRLNGKWSITLVGLMISGIHNIESCGSGSTSIDVYVNIFHHKYEVFKILNATAGVQQPTSERLPCDDVWNLLYGWLIPLIILYVYVLMIMYIRTFNLLFFPH
jgi:hypothetical protein